MCHIERQNHEDDPSTADATVPAPNPEPSLMEGSKLQVDIRFDAASGIVWARAEGPLNKENFLDLFKRFRHAALAADCRQILCDATACRLTESVLGLYENPLRLEKEGIPRTLRVAVVFERDEQKHRFWETVARNRGYMVRVFKQKPDAVEWLLDARRY